MRHGLLFLFLIIHKCILDYINYHIQLSETINYEKYIVVSLKIVVFIKYVSR
jgi:hypothetical protein